MVVPRPQPTQEEPQARHQAHTITPPPRQTVYALVAAALAVGAAFGFWTADDARQWAEAAAQAAGALANILALAHVYDPGDGSEG